MSQEQISLAFDATSHLLNDRFPKIPPTGDMYDQWQECELYAEHVMCLVDRYRDLREEGVTLIPTPEFCGLLNNYAW
jgi:hypothetical protein